MTNEGRRRNSRQRQLILEELRKVAFHPTAGDVYDMVRKVMPRISLGTVYRNLELLAGNGVIQKLGYDGAEARFDGNPVAHNHIRCTACGRVGDLNGIPVDNPGKKLGNVDGWKILDCRIEFIGVCPECRHNKGARS